MIRYPSESRLQQCVFVQVEGVDHWEFRAPVRIPESSDDLLVTWTGERLDQLATRFYGSPLYRWVIASANDLPFAEADLYPGSRLRIPSERFVREDLPRLMRQGRQ